MCIIEKVRKAINQYRLIVAGELVLVAVSGGPDSLAMLEILHRLADEYHYKLHVVHLNHQIRKEAGKEADFVRCFAAERDIPVTILQYDIPELLNRTKGSMQDVAREVRYQLFQEVAAKVGASKIALGHHADDLAETVMMRFLRGAGLEGLVGFTAKSREKLIRPLILLKHSEIEEFCQLEGLTPCLDPSNAKPVYFRNRIRLELLPLLEAKYNNNLRQQLVQMSHLLAEENDLLEEYAWILYQKILIKEEPGMLIFNFNAMSKKNPAMIRRILRLGMEKLKGDKKDLYYQHYLQMQGLVLDGTPGKLIDLPGGYVLYRGYEVLKLGRKEAVVGQGLQQRFLPVPGKIYLPESDLSIQAEIKEGQVFLSGQEAACDADLIGKELMIRSRKPGDWFYPLGPTGKKKVKDYLIDAKIDRDMRDLIPVVTTTSGDIVWLAGLRLDERFKVTEKTIRTCLLTISKGRF